MSNFHDGLILKILLQRPTNSLDNGKFSHFSPLKIFNLFFQVIAMEGDDILRDQCFIVRMLLEDHFGRDGFEELLTGDVLGGS